MFLEVKKNESHTETPVPNGVVVEKRTSVKWLFEAKPFSGQWWKELLHLD